MQLGVPGPVEVETGAGDRLVVAAPEQRTLLACPALRANLAVSTDVLMEAVWPADQRPVASDFAHNRSPELQQHVLDSWEADGSKRTKGRDNRAGPPGQCPGRRPEPAADTVTGHRPHPGRPVRPVAQHP